MLFFFPKNHNYQKLTDTTFKQSFGEIHGHIKTLGNILAYCVWAPWSSWTVCPVPCKDGSTQSRKRVQQQQAQYGGRPCEGESVEIKKCPPCPVGKFIPKRSNSTESVVC